MWACFGIDKVTLNDQPRLLTVDLDDTLWPCFATIRRAEDALYDWIAKSAPDLVSAHDQQSLRQHRKMVAQDNSGIAHDLTAVRHASLSALLRDFGYQAALADDAISVFLRHRNQVEPFADVIPALRDLRRHYRLVSVTNGNADVSQTPLNGLFDLSLTAADVGAQKPDPALFRNALEWAGLVPALGLHVGDHPFLDVEAARGFGMAAVWVNRDGQTWPDELVRPEAEVADLRQLGKRLASIRREI